MDRKTLTAVLLAIAVFVALCLADALSHTPQPPDRPANGVIGRVFRWVIYQTIFGDAPAASPPVRSYPQAPRSAIADSKYIDHGEGW